MRARTIVRWTPKADELLVSGLLDTGDEMAGRATVVDAPLGKGHVVLFGTRPMWRWQSQGAFALMMNAMANWNALDVNERAPAASPVAATAAGSTDAQAICLVGQGSRYILTTQTSDTHEDLDRILHDLKLRAPGHQFGGRDHGAVPGRRSRAEAELGWTVRSHRGRRARFREVEARIVTRSRAKSFSLLRAATLSALAR